MELILVIDLKFFNVLPKQCNGGPSMERSLSVHIVQKAYAATASFFICVTAYFQ